jgi:hypothetical protein
MRNTFQANILAYLALQHKRKLDSDAKDSNDEARKKCKGSAMKNVMERLLIKPFCQLLTRWPMTSG